MRLRASTGPLILILLGSPAAAGEGGPPASSRQAILVALPGLSFEEAVGDPLLRDLSRAGGIGLMTAAGAEGPAAAAVTIGAGRAAAEAPSGPIRFDDVGGGVVVDLAGVRERADPAVPGTLGSVLAATGRTVGYLDPRGASADPAMLAAIDTSGRIPLASLNEFPTLGGVFPPSVTAGDDAPAEAADLVVTPAPRAVRYLLERSTAERVMVLAVALSPTPAMDRRGDVVTPAVLAVGSPATLLEGGGDAGGLTSDTTRRRGVVSNVDAAPTIASFLGATPPEGMVGAPMRVEGDPPTRLHERSLEWRQVVTPVGVAVLAIALLAMGAGLLLVFGRIRPGAAMTRGVAVAGLGTVALLVLLVPVALLPSFELPLVLGVLGAGAAGLLLLATRADGGGGRRAVAVLAAVGVAVVVLDGLLGWPSGLTPFLGGSALDGERFFGLGNPYAGILLSGAVLVAARLRVPAGTAVIVAAALFAGLPFLGADLGGGLTLFLAAGLFAGLHRWRTLGWRTWALAAAAGALGLAALLISHRVLPPGTTHVSRAVASSSGPLGVVEVWWRRLLLNVETTTAAAPIWPVVLALPAWLLALLRPPASLRPMLEADEAWWRAATVLAAAGIAGYVLNDTYGTATITFVFLSAAVLYPALRRRAGPDGAGDRAAPPGTSPAGLSPAGVRARGPGRPAGRT